MAMGIALITSAADARPLHSVHHERAPDQYGRAYDAYPYSGTYGANRPSSEEFTGTSVPYDPDGPSYNDFQMQGRGE
jgi:hypothetical protein